MASEKRGPLGHLEVQVCVDCKWLWLEPGQLDALDESVWVDSEQLDYRRIPTEKPDRCPFCDEVMHLLAVPGRNGTLFRCPVCRGFWLSVEALEGVRKATFEAMDGTLDGIETVGPVTKDKPDIIAMAKRDFRPDQLDKLIGWVKGKLRS